MATDSSQTGIPVSSNVCRSSVGSRFPRMSFAALREHVLARSSHLYERFFQSADL